MHIVHHPFRPPPLAGKAFAAGADIKMMAGKKFADVMRSNMFGELEILKSMQTPTIAAVNGFAFGGGCELAMCCDIIVASKAAAFGQPEIKIGTIPGLGGTQRLTQAVGKSRAMVCMILQMLRCRHRTDVWCVYLPCFSLLLIFFFQELCLTGEPISADQAERAGLVSHVVDPDKLMPKAMEIAGRIAALSKPIGNAFLFMPTCDV